MNKLLLLGVGSALAFTMGGIGSAQADNGPHVSTAKGVGLNQAVTADRCAGCHRIHTAKSTDGYLLKTTTQEALCFNCHGPAASGASTDVVDGVGYENPTTGTQSRDRAVSPDSGVVAGALRGGGFTNARLNASGATATFTDTGTVGAPKIRALESSKLIPALTAGEAVNSSHSVGTAGTAWGNGAVGTGVGKSITLECGSCHDPHGNGNFRILRAIPVDSGTTSSTDALGVATTGVSIPDAITKVYTTTNYWLSGDRNVPAVAGGGAPAATVPDGYIANVAQWCTTCHTRYNAPSGSRTTPQAGEDIYMYRHTSTENTKVTGSKNCITCHVSHGSNASGAGTEASRVTNPGGVGVAPGDSRLLRVDNRGVCLMCHNV